MLFAIVIAYFLVLVIDHGFSIVYVSVITSPCVALSVSCGMLLIVLF